MSADRPRGDDVKVKIQRIGGHALPLPKYETAGASGFDLRAWIPSNDDVLDVVAGEVIRVSCGFAFEVPEGHELQVRPRSGLSSLGIHVSLGTVDSDYRGPVGIVVHNLSGQSWRVLNGDRIAQGVIAPVVRVEVEEAESLTPTSRGGNGFGSTGVR